MIEEWRSIPEWDYEASSLGRIRNAKGRIMTARPNYKGYFYISLRQNGRQVHRGVHAWVCEAFYGPRPEPWWHAGHLDGNKTNNTVSNLAWVTPKENAAHKKLHGTENYGEDHPRHLLTAAQVKFIREVHASGHRLFGVRPLATVFGVSTATMRELLNGQTWPLAALRPTAQNG